MGKVMRAIDMVITIGGIGALVLLLWPGGPAWSHLESWQKRRTTAAEIERLWPELVDSPATLGNPSGEHVLVEFIDYECPFCRASHDVIERMLHKNDDARVVIRHLPIRRAHPAAEDAARAAICATVQHLFSRMHEFLITDDNWNTATDWLLVAEDLGIEDPGAFLICLFSDVTTSRLARDEELARMVAVTSTPDFLARGRRRSGLVEDTEELERLLEIHR